jgi:hypothetical protein
MSAVAARREVHSGLVRPLAAVAVCATACATVPASTREGRLRREKFEKDGAGTKLGMFDEPKLPQPGVPEPYRLFWHGDRVKEVVVRIDVSNAGVQAVIKEAWPGPMG